MEDSQKIQEAIVRSKKALSLKPALGMSTGVSKVKVTNGLACTVTEGKWTLSADMPESIGGNGSAPTPGIYGRAAFGTCLAIGYMMRAAEMNVKIHSLEVEVQADFDDGALLGTSKNPPGYLEVRYTVKVESDSTEEEIMKMIEETDKHSPYLDVFSRPQKCIREVMITSPKTVN